MLSPEDERTKERRFQLADIVRRLRGPSARVLPHPGEVAGEQRVAGGRSGALRAAIFGVNDGLVSNLSLIFGVAGAGVSNRVILLAGIAGVLAGAFSMAGGEYVSMKVQREVFERLIHLEAHEIGTMPDEEREELAELYERKGIPPALADQVAEVLMADPETALQTHAREELGLDPGGLGSPWAAAGSSFVMFAFGALVPLIPFLFWRGTTAVATSAVLSGATLYAVGAAMSYFTGKRFYAAGTRMLLVGSAAAAITFGVGKLFDVAVSG